MNGQEDFFPQSSQTQPMQSLLCESTESEQTQEAFAVQTTLSSIHQYQAGRFPEPLLRENHSTMHTDRTLHCLFLSLVLWPQTSCSQRKAAESYLISAQSNSPRFMKSNNNVVPKRNKTSSSTLPASQPPGTPLPGGKHKPDCPQENNSPKMTTFSICKLVFFFFNMCVVCFFLCQKSTSLSFCLLFVLLPVQWKCIGFSVSDYTSSHTQFITPCPKEQM